MFAQSECELSQSRNCVEKGDFRNPTHLIKHVSRPQARYFSPKLLVVWSAFSNALSITQWLRHIDYPSEFVIHSS